ncbi:MAG: DUF2797 domain-containing protein, partial [Gammaproteobacteria bacterium]|nr:DUF2797 domain-containing protein [Gammaproteobacteria bacterium]
MMIGSGRVRKMRSEAGAVVNYYLPLGEEEIPLNPLLGEKISLSTDGSIRCIACGRSSKKSFNQGYCYPCFRDLPQCDRCIVRPELCHYHHGSCRDAAWGERHCLQEHVVYLANTSGLKVGITRATQIPTRWIDQGATAAIPIFRVRERLLSGEIEVALKAYVADKTAWQRMLKGEGAAVDLLQARQQLLQQCADVLAEVVSRWGEDALQLQDGEQPQRFNYPMILKSAVDRCTYLST